MMPNKTPIYYCFAATILLGFGSLLQGYLLVPIMPHFQLDVVLTTDELKDDALRNSTLALLKKASASESHVWVIGGLLHIAVGVAGLLFTSRQGRQKGETHSPT